MLLFKIYPFIKRYPDDKQGGGVDNENEGQINKEEKNKSDKKHVKTPDEIDAAALQKLKESSVSKDEYLKLQKKYEDAVGAIIDGRTVQKQQEGAPVDTEKRIQELRESLFNPKKPLTNLQYAKNALELRQLLLDDGQPDVFMPTGSRVRRTGNEAAQAQRVAEGLKELIDKSEGNDALFTGLLGSSLIPDLGAEMAYDQRKAREKYNSRR